MNNSDRSAKYGGMDPKEAPQGNITIPCHVDRHRYENKEAAQDDIGQNGIIALNRADVETVPYDGALFVEKGIAGVSREIGKINVFASFNGMPRIPEHLYRKIVDYIGHSAKHVNQNFDALTEGLAVYIAGGGSINVVPAENIPTGALVTFDFTPQAEKNIPFPTHGYSRTLSIPQAKVFNAESLTPSAVSLNWMMFHLVDDKSNPIKQGVEGIPVYVYAKYRTHIQNASRNMLYDGLKLVDQLYKTKFPLWAQDGTKGESNLATLTNEQLVALAKKYELMMDYFYMRWKLTGGDESFYTYGQPLGLFEGGGNFLKNSLYVEFKESQIEKHAAYYLGPKLVTDNNSFGNTPSEQQEVGKAFQYAVGAKEFADLYNRLEATNMIAGFCTTAAPKGSTQSVNIQANWKRYAI